MSETEAPRPSAGRRVLAAIVFITDAADVSAQVTEDEGAALKGRGHRRRSLA